MYNRACDIEESERLDQITLNERHLTLSPLTPDAKSANVIPFSAKKGLLK